MDVRDFWCIVEASRDDVRERQLATLRAALDGLDEERRAGFRACFVGLMRYACDSRFWDASEIAFGGMDIRTFFGVRAWLISRGRDAYMGILAEPDALARYNVASFPEFAELAGGEGTAPATFGGLDPTNENIDLDDEDAVRSTFPALWARYCAPGPRDAALLSWLFTTEERVSRARKSRASIALVLVSSGLAIRCLPWWAAVFACAGSVAVWASLLIALERRRWVGGFVSRARAVGHADRLVGDVDVSVVYAHPDGARVPKADDKVSAALAFLVAEAQRHGVELRFRRTPSEPIVLNTPKLHDANIDAYAPAAIAWLERSLAPLLPEGNAFVVVITSERQCVPSAWHATRFRPRELEFCVCPVDASPKTIAHEILHLFGARDLYRPLGPGGRTPDDVAREVAAFIESVTGENILETSVMTNRQGPNLRVDPATASSVGWTDRVAGHIVPLYGADDMMRRRQSAQPSAPAQR